VLPSGQEVRRLESPHRRVYQSVFGRFEVERVVYLTFRTPFHALEAI
jgi:hypothetical protein